MEAVPVRWVGNIIRGNLLGFSVYLGKSIEEKKIFDRAQLQVLATDCGPSVLQTEIFGDPPWGNPEGDSNFQIVFIDD